VKRKGTLTTITQNGGESLAGFPERKKAYALKKCGRLTVLGVRQKLTGRKKEMDTEGEFFRQGMDRFNRGLDGPGGEGEGGGG